MPVCNKCHGALPEHCVCKEGISRYMNRQSQKARRAEKEAALKHHQALNNELTDLEQRVLLKIVEAADMDRQLPLSKLRWTRQEVAAIPRIHVKLAASMRPY